MPFKDPKSPEARESNKRSRKKWALAHPNYYKEYQWTERNREYKRKWKKLHPEYPKQVWQRRRERVFAIYGSVCAKCGFSDKRALQLDHVNNDGHKHRVTRKDGKRTTDCKLAWTEAAKGYQPDKFQILCANCNWIKREELLCAKNQTPA